MEHSLLEERLGSLGDCSMSASDVSITKKPRVSIWDDNDGGNNDERDTMTDQVSYYGPHSVHITGSTKIVLSCIQFNLCL